MSQDKNIALAREGVAQMFSSYKTDMTELELNLWRYEIDRLGPTAMLSFVRYWTSGGGQSSFLRAPRIDDFKRRMDSSFVSSEDALEILRNEVRTCGPYANPGITDPKLQGAVLALGGWAKVCNDMPDATLIFESRQFSDRFKVAWMQGEAAVLQGRAAPQPLLGLVAAPRQLGLAVTTSLPVGQSEPEVLDAPAPSF